MFFKTTKATKCYFRFSYSLSLDYPRYFFLFRDCLELKEDKLSNEARELDFF